MTMWPKSKTKKIAVAFHGVKINIDLEMPIIKAGIIELMRGHSELALSRTREGVLSLDQLTRDVQAREQQISLLQDADAASSYHASRIEIERTAKLLAIQAEIFAKRAPIVFVGDSEQATAVDFCFAAAHVVAKVGDGEISYQVKALLQIALECAQAEASAARIMIELQTPKAAEPVKARVTPPRPKPPLLKQQQAPATNVVSNILFSATPAQMQEDDSDDEPWKSKRIGFNKKRDFTTAEYLAHFKKAYSIDTAEEQAGSFEVSLRLLDYANALRVAVSNIVSLRKSDLTGVRLWTIVRRFLDEFFSPGFEKQSLRVSAIMNALLDAEDLNEEGGDPRFILNHLVVASTLLDGEVAFQQAAQAAKAKPEQRKPTVSGPIIRMETLDPDAE
ncbi:hypothetical protein HFO91_30305 [Rhizobium leguminosarum]|uniref:hypothetical protein n=1 Tax=Rhizobium leguminosarum TaxID=384 RepID=UPI001C940A60|nr:hypothetical protein [Rhizobium leguminosarum]MBY5453872.1 hypothetical protein [Rhizobium leguminosarum]